MQNKIKSVCSQPVKNLSCEPRSCKKRQELKMHLSKLITCVNLRSIKNSTYTYAF